MADNILRGIIEIDAKGVAASTNQVNAAISKTEQSLKKVAPAANQANFALTNLGRVAQDAPFGFIAIQNNLNPLLESFQRLRAESGSNSAALKALGSSLLGAGGLGFALSIASSALLIFTNGFQSFSRKSKEAKEAADELGDAIKGIFAEAGKEAAQVEGFITVLKSETETRERKLAAIKELQKIQPQVFADLKLEGNAVAGLDLAYQNYLANLRTVIQAKVLQAKLEQLITKQLEAQGATATGKNKEILDGLINLQQQAKNGQLGKNPLAETLILGDKNRAAFLSGIQKEINDILAQLGQVSGGIKVPEIKVTPEKLKIEKPRRIDVDDILPKLPKILDLEPKQGKARRPDERFANKTDEERAALLKLQKDLLTTQQIGLYLSETLSNAFSGLVDAIGQGRNVLQAFGQAVKQVVVDLIKALVQAAIFSFLTKAFGIVIPTGGGGNPFSGLFGGRRAVGGGVSAGKSYLVGENGPELFAPSMGGNIIPNGRLGSYGGGSLMGQVQFVISGTNLIGVLANANRSQTRLV